jgi:hypothetical protein
MFKTVRLSLALLITATALIACNDKESSDTEATPAASSATETAAPAAVAPAPVAAPEITVGMTEKEVTAKYGGPAISQTRQLDSFVITNSEWNHDKGTTSVQFQNGEAKYVIEIPASK